MSFNKVIISQKRNYY